jgi:hypothetical protein
VSQARVVVLCVAAACTYGVLHDEVTVHLCPEYFTVAHPPYFPTSSLTLLGLYWGVAATAGIGIALGIILSRITHSPGLPPYPDRLLVRRIAKLLATMAVAAMTAGLAGFELAAHRYLSLPQAFAEVIAPADHARFMAAWFAHGASYLFGLSGGIALCLSLWKQRGRPWVMDPYPRSHLAYIRCAIIVLLSLLACAVVFAVIRPHD